MTLLLDTHTVLWYWWDDPHLSVTAKGLISDPANTNVISPTTPWEVAIKVCTGKLRIPGGYAGYFPHHMRRTRFAYHPTTDDHFAAVATLPFHHRDPFDRLIVAQALVEKVAVVSTDAALDAYGVTRLW